MDFSQSLLFILALKGIEIAWNSTILIFLGKRVTVYVTDVNFSTDISKIGQFVTELEKSDTVVSSINTFYPSFYDYVLEYYGTEINSTGMFSKFS